jgi:hypothetical protein
MQANNFRKLVDCQDWQDLMVRACLCIAQGSSTATGCGVCKRFPFYLALCDECLSRDGNDIESDGALDTPFFACTGKRF